MTRRYDPEPVRCIYCGKRFGNQTALIVHEAAHERAARVLGGTPFQHPPMETTVDADE